MTRRFRRAIAAVLTAASASLGACSRASAPPGDPLLNAIRAEERGSGDLSYAESQGRHLFLHYCATCHGEEGRGDGQNASNLNPPPPDMAVSESIGDTAYVRKVITEGSAAAGRSPLSPPWGRNLSRQEVDDLVAYCRAIGRVKR